MPTGEWKLRSALHGYGQAFETKLAALKVATEDARIKLSQLYAKFTE